MDWQHFLPVLFSLGGMLCAFALGYGIGHRAGFHDCWYLDQRRNDTTTFEPRRGGAGTFPAGPGVIPRREVSLPPGQPPRRESCSTAAGRAGTVRQGSVRLSGVASHGGRSATPPRRFLRRIPMSRTVHDLPRGNQAAFPTSAERGLTIREWLTGQALAGLLAGSYVGEAHALEPWEVAKDAMDYADALLVRLGGGE